jgi:hypothetical protein
MPSLHSPRPRQAESALAHAVPPEGLLLLSRTTQRRIPDRPRSLDQHPLHTISRML